MAAEGVVEANGWGQGQGCGQACADQAQVGAQRWGRRSEEKGGLRSQQRGGQRQRQGQESDVVLQQSEQPRLDANERPGQGHGERLSPALGGLREGCAHMPIRKKQAQRSQWGEARSHSVGLIV